MTHPAVGILLAVALLATAVRAETAHAQDPERYRIVISGGHPASSFSLRDRDGATLAERCAAPCDLTLPRGKLRLELFDAQGTMLGARSIGVDRNAAWTATPHDTGTRDVGLALGIGGLVLLNVGAVLWLLNADLHSHSDSSDGGPTRAGIGALMALGGAIITPIGAVMFFGNLRPRLERRPLGPYRD